jgi:hypothetical protein
LVNIHNLLTNTPNHLVNIHSQLNLICLCHLVNTPKLCQHLINTCQSQALNTPQCHLHLFNTLVQLSMHLQLNTQESCQFIQFSTPKCSHLNQPIPPTPTHHFNSTPTNPTCVEASISWNPQMVIGQYQQQPFAWPIILTISMPPGQWPETSNPTTLTYPPNIQKSMGGQSNVGVGLAIGSSAQLDSIVVSSN